ncbi:MAG: RAD52 family DNA repair protein [Alphaproteobacteria bacterium]
MTDTNANTGFTASQKAMLAAPLNAANVKNRQQAGQNLSYIEGWHAIAEANRIFGFDRWDRQLLSMKQLGEPREVNGKWRVAYMATVRITVTAGDAEIIRDGTGFGSGIDKDVGQAHESAIKEAETDAMKRSLMTFGNPFGLALYDKTQENVEHGPTDGEKAAAGTIKLGIDQCEDTEALTAFWKKHIKEINGLPDALKQDLINHAGDRKRALTPSVAAE